MASRSTELLRHYTPFTMPGPHDASDVWQLIFQVHNWLHEYNYTYIWLGCGDHGAPNAKQKPDDPDDVMTDCDPSALPLFLLVVERGVFLGANGWHEDYGSTLFLDPFLELLHSSLFFSPPPSVVLLLIVIVFLGGFSNLALTL